MDGVYSKKRGILVDKQLKVKLACSLIILSLAL